MKNLRETNVLEGHRGAKKERRRRGFLTPSVFKQEWVKKNKEGGEPKEKKKLGREEMAHRIVL